MKLNQIDATASAEPLNNREGDLTVSSTTAPEVDTTAVVTEPLAVEETAESIFSSDLSSTDESAADVASVIETEGVAQSSFNNGFDDSTFVASCYAGELDPAGSCYGGSAGYMDYYGGGGGAGYGGDCFYGDCGFGYGGYPDWGYGGAFCDGYGCYGDPYFSYGGGFGFNPYFGYGGYGGYPYWGSGYGCYGAGNFCSPWCGGSGCPYFGGQSSYCMYG